MTRTNTGDQPAANRGNTSDFDWHPTGEQEDRMRRQCLEDIERLQRETDIASRELPIEKVRDDFDQALTEFDVVSVEASTGAGKSLDLGVWTVEALGGKNARVAMTQPRRDAAEGVCVAAAARHGLKFGEDICFTTSEFKGNRRDTKLQISTTGVLINKFKKDPTLADYNAVIVDEAHERDLNIDLTIGLLKRANQLRAEAGQPAIKIILASATLEQGKFAEFFGINEKARIQSEGKLHKVNEVYTESEYKFATNPVTGETVERPYPAIATQQVIDILSTTKQGDILVFMPGIQSIRDVQRQVQFSPEIRDQAVEILILHGSNTQKERSYVLQGSRDKSTRRVVISTNMAETSVTVPGIKYVVDGARKNEMQYDASTGLETLTDVPASQAECKQRRGRAGRITTGEYHTVLTEEEYGKLEKYPKPEILRRELDGVVLEMLRLGITDVENFDLPDKAPKKNIKEALRKLEMLGAITTDNQLTEIGKLMAELPLEPRHARVVVAAMEKGCVREAVAVTAAIGKNSIFRRPGKAEFAVAEKALKDSGSRYVDERAIRIAASEVLRTKQQKLREGTSSDWVLFLNIFKKFMRAGNKHAFCEEFALDYESLEGVADNFHRVIKELKRSKIDVSSSEDENSLTESILMGYAPDHLIMQTQSRNGVEFNRVDRGDRDVRINSSSIAFSNKPELAVCLDLEPGKGTKVIGRRGSEETEFKYAVGVHPVTSERLRAVVPHRVKRGESPQDFDFKNGQVLSKFSYDYKTQSGGWTSIPIDYVPDQNPQATEFFAKQILAFTDKKLQDFFQVINNKEVEQELQNLYHRSRGQTEQFDLKDWYARKLGTSISVNEAKKAGSTHYHLNTTEIVSEAQKREVELAAPTTITMAGSNWPVKYNFRPANPDSWYESEKIEIFEVVVDLNRSSFEETYQKIMSIKPGDVQAARAQIGILKESEPLLLEAKLDWEFKKIEDIEELQKLAEERYLFKRWCAFSKPTFDKITIEKGGSFPEFASFSAEPIAFAILANGQSVMAYPAWDKEYMWSPEGQYT
ncbi:MAG: ATP-dependent RNA helicase, partial [Candidatus Magasanikbacteria bacterium]|nr:ATP-dependent RNA helicase [Candidatus Magasanikbacteria bacterium]